jgi:hypothetical protein
MQAEPMFPGAPRASGMYESFYLRAVSPREPVGIWIRHTVHKRPGRAPTGSVWCTVFDAAAEGPFTHKTTSELLRAPAGSWIEVGAGATMGPQSAHGECGPARWSLRIAGIAPELRHLRPSLLYRAPVPRTKLTSPAPLARFDGVVEVPGRGALDVTAWPGMVGHNWGAEHAARWIWLHGCDFEGAPQAWLDVALGRVRVGSRLTPWLANGMLSVGGAAHRLGGIGAPRPRVAERAGGAELELFGRRGLRVSAHAEVPPGSAAGWRYVDPGNGDDVDPDDGEGEASPDAGGHDVVNCSIARLSLELSHRGAGGRRLLHSDHGGAYELGMTERDHGVPLAPFADG